MATLTVLEGTNAGREYEIPDLCFLGRSAQCDVRVGDLTVSRKHCRIQRQGGKYFVEDLGSGNGTFVNRQPVVRGELSHNDEIRIGHSRFRFNDKGRQLPAIHDVRPSHPQQAQQGHPTPIAPIAPPRPKETGRTTIDRAVDASQDLLLKPLDALGRAELERLYRRLQTVYAVSQAVSNILTIDKLLDEIMRQLMQVFPQAERGAVLVMDEGTSALMVQVLHQRPSPAREAAAVDPRSEIARDLVDMSILTQPVLEAVVGKRKAVLLSDRPASDPPPRQITMTGVHQGAIMCAPLCAGGEVLGLLVLSAAVAQVFHRDDLDLHAGIAVQAGSALANARLHDRLMKQDRMQEELRVAEQIQRSFLPRSQPYVPGYSFFAHYDPAYEVGGDFYDFIALPDGRMAILIGDVSGKGVPAALLMARMASELRVCALSEREPGRVLGRVNRALIEMGHTDMFVTAIYAVLDPVRRTVTWSNAGHLPPYLRRARELGHVELLETGTSTALGILPDTEYIEDTVELSLNDSMVFLTDGVVEAKSASGQEFGFPRLGRVIGGAKSAGEILSRVVDQVTLHVGGEAQYDDLTIVCLGHCAQQDNSGEVWTDKTRRVLGGSADDKHSSLVARVREK